jgi:hypothetical protein
MDNTHVTVEVYVPLELAIRSNYGRFGVVPLQIALTDLSPDEKELLLSWGKWNEGPLSAVLVGAKGEWRDAESARKGLYTIYSRITARATPPVFADAARALAERRDREPQNMLFEKIAQERRATDDLKVQDSKLVKVRWWKRLFGGV